MNWTIFLGAITLIGSCFAWFYNEWQKRADKIINEKEERYQQLIILLRHFGGKFQDDEKANKFILEWQLSWMYCSDGVIKKGNELLK